MRIRNTAKRLSSFVVSVMPADRAFFFLLLGSTFLFISPSLGWWNGWQTDIFGPSRVLSVGTGKHWGSAWRQILLFAPFPLRVAGAAGFFVCFFPGRMPLRRLHLLVYFPAVLGIALPFLLVSAAALALQSKVNPWGNGDLFSLSGISRLAWNAGPGLHFTLLGLVCVALGESRFRRGLAVLPVHLKSSYLQVSDIPLLQSDQRNWTRFVWVAITLMNAVTLIGSVIAGSIVAVEFDIVYYLYHYHEGYSYPVWLVRIIALMIGPAVLLSLILCLVGERRREVLRNSFRLPFPEYFAIALFLPIAVYSVPHIFAHRHDPLLWITLPLRADRSPIPPAFMLLELFLLALIEEIAWRGYLQPRFIAHFGLYRGIFFVGIVWGAFHFSGDFRADQTDANVIRYLVGRLVGTILIGFALSWLTLRSKSVLPAAVTHTAINRISRESFATPFWLALVFWAVIDLLLFRFWPPREIASGTSEPFLGKAKSAP